MSLLTDSIAAQLAELALIGIPRPFPYKRAVVWQEGHSPAPPRSLTPVFYGCFDWHSAVHSHWALVRLARLLPQATWRDRALTLLNEQLHSDALAQEHAFVKTHPHFECPYGLAWVLQLALELREWSAELPDTFPGSWARALAPLEHLAAERIIQSLEGLPYPIRTGQHNQSAFAMGLALDWASANDPTIADRLCRRAVEFYSQDRDAPVAYEPSGHDFLSPALAEADVMRRVLGPAAFSVWLDDFVPHLEHTLTEGAWQPLRSPDPADGKLSHLDGLNLSRAWMMDGVAHALSDDDCRRASLIDSVQAHARVGLASIDATLYAGAHWLGSFAVYALTQRGL